MKKKELYIPVNVPERNDFIEGFGAKELFYTAISFVIGAILAVTAYIVMHLEVFFAFLILAMIVTLTVLFTKRDSIDESFIDKIGFILSYNKAQKKYSYVYWNNLQFEDMKGLEP